MTPGLWADQSAPAEPSPQQQTVALKMRLHLVLQSLEQSCQTVRQLEAELDAFLQRYYTAVGPRFEELAKLEHELQWLRDTGRPIAPVVPTPLPAYATEHRRAIDAQVKHLYRSMVKECHPDSAPTQASSRQEVMRAINEAYAKRNIADLWRAKCQMETWHYSDDSEALNAHLRVQQEAIAQQLAHIQTRQRELESSAAYALMQRALQLKLCGQDFIEVVQHHVRQQIETTRRELVIAKIKQNSLRLHQESA